MQARTLLALSAAALLLAVSSFLTLLQNLLLLLSLLLLALAVGKLKAQGLATFLPDWALSLLFRRSIFDVLCDVYFLKRISKLIAAVVGPIVHQSTPAEAHKHFEQLQKPVRNAIFTRGIANLVPSLVDSLLPAESQPRKQFLARSGIAIGVRSQQWDKSQWFCKRQVNRLRKRLTKGAEPQPAVSKDELFEKVRVLSHTSFAERLAQVSPSKLAACAMASLLLMGYARKMNYRSMRTLLHYGAGAGGLTLLCVAALLAVLKLRAGYRRARLRYQLLKQG